MRRKIKITILALLSIVLLFLLLAIGVPYINFTATSTDDNPNKKNIIVIAHRGASGLAPENTLASFAKAMEFNVDFIELDVHVSKDDSLIVMHDYNVERTTSGEGDIEDLTYSYIKTLDAGSEFKPEFKGEKVPTLDEVLKLSGGKTKVLIELKWPKDGLYKDLVKKVVECVRRNKAESWIVIQSFEISYLDEMHVLAPDLECQQLVFAPTSLLPMHVTRKAVAGNFTPLPYVTSVNPHHLFITKAWIKRMHKEHKTVYPFTLNTEDKMRKAINLGVDGIITNFPDVANKVLGRTSSQ
jgi:glycerophosphoryl diester phosphodiesterase